MPHSNARDIAVIDGPQGLLQHEFDVQTVRETEIAPGGDQILMIEDPVARTHFPAVGREIRIRRYRRRFARLEFGESQFGAARPAFLAARRAHLEPVGAAVEHRDHFVAAHHIDHGIAAARAAAHLQVGLGNDDFKQLFLRMNQTDTERLQQQ